MCCLARWRSNSHRGIRVTGVRESVRQQQILEQQGDAAGTSMKRLQCVRPDSRGILARSTGQLRRPGAGKKGVGFCADLMREIPCSQNFTSSQALCCYPHQLTLAHSTNKNIMRIIPTHAKFRTACIYVFLVCTTVHAGLVSNTWARNGGIQRSRDMPPQDMLPVIFAAGFRKPCCRRDAETSRERTACFP